MLADIKPGMQIGKYVVKKPIQQGGMAHVVWVKVNENDDYALKITRITGKSDIDSQNNVATRKEAYLLGSLYHERIVRIYPLMLDSHSADKKIYYASAKDLHGSPWFFAMEYLSGGSLSDYLTHCGPLMVDEATNIVGNVGLALNYLHHKGIAHLDIKPENVVFRRKIVKGQAYDPVLVDFGTAAGVKKFTDEAGSWYVMSPERVRGATGRAAPELSEKINPLKADIWSMGILLYQSLANSLPFAASDQRRLTSQILNDVPEPITKKNKNIPEELDRFITNECLAKKPEDRPTIKEFLSTIYVYSGRGVLATSIEDGYYGKH